MVCMQTTSDWGPVRPLATGNLKEMGLSVSMPVGCHGGNSTKRNKEKVGKAIGQ